MFLFEEKDNIVNFYKMEPDKEKVFEFKKKHLELLKTVLIYSPAGFIGDFLASYHTCTLNKSKNLDHINLPQIDPNYFVEITDNQTMISMYLNEKYINGEHLWHIILDINKRKGECLNQNCKQYGFVFIRGGFYTEYGPCNSESLLLSDEMEPLSNLLYEGNVTDIDIHDLYNPQNIEIYSLFNYVKTKEVPKSFLQNRLNFYEEETKKSQLILSLGRKAKGVKSNSTEF